MNFSRQSSRELNKYFSSSKLKAAPLMFANSHTQSVVSSAASYPVMDFSLPCMAKLHCPHMTACIVFKLFNKVFCRRRFSLYWIIHMSNSILVAASSGGSKAFTKGLVEFFVKHNTSSQWSQFFLMYSPRTSKVR